ncbi:ABC transporter G family member 23 [Cicer arietinum]|uniref:ABC transporter G family member 23 n=1 Tax=Cicer arietinum TaxID=3827 RepID=A0A1S2Z2N7_CICAR|nr:ABC transporter G family member 23 [Cicer arietinum]
MTTCLNPQTNEDDSVILFSTSNSPEDDSISPFSSSSSSYNSPPPPTLHHHYQFKKTAYKLSVKNLTYTFCQKQPAINILKSVSFVATTSEIAAVVGPSGTGKSTLLRIIAGRVKDKHFDPKTISINDQPMTSPSQLKKICCFVSQHDNLLPLLTVKETLLFSAKFRLKQMTPKDRETRVESLMQELGLFHVQNSFVGDEENRGVSGGERKRVSIGVDMIHNPPILVLDEPTSGLDSTSALHVIELLSSMVKAKKRIVILSIHQPSYRILKYISKFLILSHGSLVHNGSIESLEETISNLGFQIPIQLNALEFSMEIIQSLEEYSSSSSSSKRVTIEENETFPRTIWQEEEKGLVQFQQQYQKESFFNLCYVNFMEILFLCSRFWKIIYRTKQLFLARTMQALVGGFGLGSVYIKVRKDEVGVGERLGLFAFSLSFLLSSTVEALPIYLQERTVLMKEASGGAYRISSYMIANTIVFIPFLFVVSILFAVPVYWLVGLNPSFKAFTFFTFVVWLIVLMASSLVLFLSSISPDFISGNSLICTVLGAFFLFSGYFIPKESIPKYWIFMYYVSLYRYPLDALLINEYWNAGNECFSEQQTEGSSSKCLVTGFDVLKSRGLEKDNRWMNVGIMIGFFFFYRVLCWVILARKASKTTI